MNVDINSTDEKIYEEIETLINNNFNNYYLRLDYYLHLLLMKQQDRTNKKLFKTNRWLVYATWALVIATTLIIVFK